MEIKRDSYLEQLISYRFDGLVKVITGIRRCGKSYLLKNIYRDYLIENGVKEEQIVTVELDLAKDIKYRNPLILSSYVCLLYTSRVVCIKVSDAIYQIAKAAGPEQWRSVCNKVCTTR